MTNVQTRISRAKQARLCLNCQSNHVSHLGTHILHAPFPKSQVSEIEHRFRCRHCSFRWSEFV